MDRDDLKSENEVEEKSRKQNWTPLTSSLYGFSQQVVQVHWFAKSMLTTNFKKNSHDNKVQNAKIYIHAFQTQA